MGRPKLFPYICMWFFMYPLIFCSQKYMLERKVLPAARLSWLYVPVDSATFSEGLDSVEERSLG